MFYKKIIGCKQVLNILKDGKLHLNRDMWDILGGGFALAARVWELRKPKIDGGKYGLKIESGNPEHFNKVRQSRGDWYYQLQPKVEVRTKHLFGIKPIMRPGQRQQSLYPTGLIPKTRDLSRKVGSRN